MEQDIAAFVAMDTHKETIAVAVAEAGRSGEVRFFGEIPNRADAVRRLIDKLASNYGTLSVCYEAGPCGYGVHRQITELGHACIVVAPSLIRARDCQEFRVRAGGCT